MKLITICSLVLVLTSCSKKHDEVHYTPSPGLGGDTWAKGSIDKYLYDSLTLPYNIDVKYRWDPWEVNIGAQLVPPDEKQIIPAVEAIKKIWIETYNAETGGTDFIRKYAPKHFVMVGSAEYMPNGSMLLGQAEGGKKILMYVINNFSQTNIGALRQMLHTIEHEFAHILHQTVLYPESFKYITPDYTGTWFNMSDADAQARGFATSYARSGPDEDFVETISTMLIEGKNRWEELVTDQNATAQEALRKKEATVVDYFKKVWNIDFYSLQKRTQDAINKLSPDTFNLMFGFDKYYKRAAYVPDFKRLPDSGPAFMAAFDTAAYRLDTVTKHDVEFYRVDPIFSSQSSMTLRAYVYSKQYDQVFPLDYNFSYTKTPSNIYSFSYVSAADQNASDLKPYFQKLIDFFKSDQFKLDWYQQYSSNNSLYPKVLFTPQQNPNNYFIGLVAR
jgi:substrate import-associated zinc metallohydrolase lipoprotein